MSSFKRRTFYTPWDFQVCIYIYIYVVDIYLNMRNVRTYFLQTKISVCFVTKQVCPKLINEKKEKRVYVYAHIARVGVYIYIDIYIYTHVYN